MTDDTGQLRRGTAYGVGCYLIWGLFALYFPLLEPAGAFEILGHRVVWSLAFVLLALSVRGGFRWVRPLLADRSSLWRLTLAAVLIAGNWALYIWGVNNEHVVETSLGYFVNPVVTVLIGVVVLHERLRRLQWVAVGIGTVAVVVLTIAYGRPPWIALGLASSFGTYGLLKKQVGPRVGAIQSLTVETTVLVLPVVAFLVALDVSGNGTFGREGAGHTLLLMSAGPATAVPLVLFAAAARRVPLSLLGMLQYLTPVLQFLTGVVVYGEPMPASRWAGFALVWLALVVLSADGLRARRRTRRAGRAEEPVAA